MTQRRKRKPTKAELHATIRAVRGVLRPKPGEPSFAEQMAIWKAEDRDLERRRDERLAALFRK